MKAAILTAFANDADFATDVASGLNVRVKNYVGMPPASKNVRFHHAYCRETETLVAPFVVLLWDDGLDYDLDGNAYPDSPPDYFVQSVHATRKAAEQEAAYLERAGVRGIIIEEGYPVYRYQADHLPGGKNCLEWN